jgi:hypothetical protein
VVISAPAVETAEVIRVPSVLWATPRKPLRTVPHELGSPPTVGRRCGNVYLL